MAGRQSVYVNVVTRCALQKKTVLRVFLTCSFFTSSAYLAALKELLILYYPAWNCHILWHGGIETVIIKRAIINHDLMC